MASRKSIKAALTSRIKIPSFRAVQVDESKINSKKTPNDIEEKDGCGSPTINKKATESFTVPNAGPEKNADSKISSPIAELTEVDESEMIRKMLVNKKGKKVEYSSPKNNRKDKGILSPKIPKAKICPTNDEITKVAESKIKGKNLKIKEVGCFPSKSPKKKEKKNGRSSSKSPKKKEKKNAKKDMKPEENTESKISSPKIRRSATEIITDWTAKAEEILQPGCRVHSVFTKAGTLVTGLVTIGNYVSEKAPEVVEAAKDVKDKLTNLEIRDDGELHPKEDSGLWQALKPMFYDDS